MHKTRAIYAQIKFILYIKISLCHTMGYEELACVGQNPLFWGGVVRTGAQRGDEVFE